MRCMGGVTDQYELLVMPALAGDPLEIQPGGATQVGRIALQPMPIQITPEKRLTECDRLRRVVTVQAVGQPCLLPGFDNDRREVLAELVGMDLKPAVLGPLEGKGKG